MRRRRPALKDLSLRRLAPNVVTVLGLCAGLTAIRFALNGEWDAAVIAILVAAVLDLSDGGIARLLRVRSSFGAELDSLADMVSFGVAPAIVVYLWALEGAGGIGWVPAVVFAVCGGLRLARFNTGLEAEGEPGARPTHYFTGVPMPAAAALALLPLILAQRAEAELLASAVLNAVTLIAVGLLMVSTLPTFSLKGLRVPLRLVLPTLVGVGLVAALMVAAFWPTVAVLIFAYLASLPVSWHLHRRALAAAGERPAELASNVRHFDAERRAGE